MVYFIDLFAGIGGMRLAFEQSGAVCNFSSEWDKFCQQTYLANFGEQPFGDITQITSDQIPDHDILVGGFPCQPFSIAGVSKHNSLGNDHGFEHPTQGTLFFEVARIIKDKRPRAFLLENVKNLVSHDQGKTFKVIKETLEELGYYIYYQVLDAAAILPQHRERIFIVGFLEPVAFKFPVLPNLYPKIKDILETNVNDKYTLTDHLWQYLQNYAEKHRLKGNGFGYGLVNLESISRTLSARYYKDGSEILIPQKNKNPRRLTPRECARLMGFPETFKIVTSDTRAYKQFGNSIAVPVVQAIAQEMIASLQKPKILNYPIRSPLQLKLFENRTAFHERTGTLG
ncbi:DNA-methyltransferase Dcm [Synechococcus sp. PCC 7502]|uniref:DNA (cytosine-5-)-methyltransferase n=1 Tax=Synechococcus sp. PCC 7502 TaxID=1173263 RepID=UPI00029FDAFD|nr:DNA (cytosine-5-)-methyltransferase [Synechococcus sp. PCC 7502]AFY74143.1 DNA-methyltransferase Dcm [Synechococcus sp. PCC 7502]